MKKEVTIIDYGMGNLFNVVRAFERLGCTLNITNDYNKIMKSDRLLLPGVGAFEDGISDLKDNGLYNAIKEFVQTGRPLFGICLGMQLLMTFSEENGIHDGLDLIKGKVVRFSDTNADSNNYKIPQMGWNALQPPNKIENGTGKIFWKDSILNNLEENPYMYFVHSYFVVPEDNKICIAETAYGKDLFCSVFQKDQIIGCQFHPERSGEEGLKIIRNFINI